MRRLASWVGRNIEGVLALVSSIIIVLLNIADVGDEAQQTRLTYNGILLVLGVLTVAMLRDRSRQDESGAEIRAHLRGVQDLGPAVAEVKSQLGAVTKALTDASMVQVLSGPEVTAALSQARGNTDRWLFRGGTGTYIRAVTLPESVANARRDRRPLLVRLEVIDPTNEQVCATYAQFLRSLSATPGSQWSLERTQRESYATILAAAWHRQRYGLLDIEVGLSQVMPTLRWDLSSRCLIITHESRGGRALMVESGKLLYDYTETELRKSFDQARHVPFPQARQVELSDEPEVDEVARLFAMLDMPLPTTVGQGDVQDIIQRALHPENPYSQ
jgi:hypothetical protein